MLNKVIMPMASSRALLQDLGEHRHTLYPSKDRSSLAERALGGAQGQLALDAVKHAALQVRVPQEKLLVRQQAFLQRAHALGPGQHLAQPRLHARSTA